ncbi:MAG: PIN/TRAM domain-containing protein, partial [Acidobacteriota bacterium]|nr:PIN/TRAM domain-containing protein [Acidobacteriota bacterium]
MLDFILVRLIFALVFICTAAYFRPAETALWAAVLVGMALAAAAILLETRFQRISVRRLIGIAGGMVVGLLCAALISLVLGRLGAESSGTLHFAQVICLLLFVYFGAVTGAAKGELLNLGGAFGAETSVRRNHKILDTSVIIDGRIADIADTGFLDGVLVIPQFVLQELQMVADSADSMKRNRGRRGLDVLQRIQKMSHLKVEIVQEDFPHVREVDMKLIELAQLYNCRIVTNDFNLNKVAHVRGVDVLNINELANSVKPIV